MMATLELTPSLDSLVDEDEISHTVVQQLNSIFGNDLKNLEKVSELVEELTKTRDELEKRLRFATTEAPDKITKAVKAAEEALSKEKSLEEECNNLQEQANAHTQKYDDLLNDIGPGVRQVRELERVKLYQEFVSAVDEQSKEIEAALHIGAEGQALVGYCRLMDTTKAVQGSHCLNLVAFVTNTLLYWHQVFTLRFTSEFEGVLKTIKWPFTTGNDTVHQPPASPESLQRLCTLTQYLLQLSLPDNITSENSKRPESPVASPAIVTDFVSPVLPIHLLVRPLEVRFFFHFSGNKPTNSRENPEWYFTQILKWISAHENFLNSRIQPVLNRLGHQNTSAKVEFMRGLVRLVVIKLAADLPDVQFDDDIFCSTVQETLNFEREMSLTYGYPSSQPSVLSVLTQGRIFARWIHVERKFAQELMDELVSDEGAWVAVEGGEAAHCGERLILLLQGITDRYKRLPQPGHRLQFLELQLELLDDFRVRVLQVMKSERQDPLTSHYPAILNTVHHITATLHDWADLPFFVEMQYYQECFSNIQEQTSAAIASYDSTTASSTSPDDPGSFTFNSLDVSLLNSSISPELLARQDALDTLNVNAEVPTTAQLTEVLGSVFDGTMKLYTHIEGEMVRTLASYVFSEVRARSQPYRQDKWFHTVNPGASMDFTKINELSPSICPLLEVLARHLHALRDVLAAPLFMQLWKIVADTLNKYVYEEVILQTRFSDVGAAQFKFDMTRGIFPIFGAFTQKPENFFRLVKESVILLTLPHPTAFLLRDTIHMWHDDQDAFSLVVSPVKALGEHGVTLLKPKEADTVLNIRINERD
ncbi:RAD50-interacting protein 1-like [Homarus americanus]|uniref:RAD50-interacting protein 1-like n=1 Tax=Homarus americanus TaxID=6706 RepID=UPI001C48ACCB|nr:RAD50-interacting protein 1-like [Homarus americanus]